MKIICFQNESNKILAFGLRMWEAEASSTIYISEISFKGRVILLSNFFYFNLRTPKKIQDPGCFLLPFSTSGLACAEPKRNPSKVGMGTRLIFRSLNFGRFTDFLDCLVQGAED